MSKWVLGSIISRPPSGRQSGRALFTVQRRGLVDNAINSFGESPALPHGVIMSGRDTSPRKRLQVASIDTLLSWYCEGGKYATDFTYDTIVFDEAHSHVAKLATFLRAHEAKRRELGLYPAYVLGLTATPEARGLADVFNEIVPGPEIQWLIDNGFLSPFTYFGGKSGKLDLLKWKGADFESASVAAAMDGLAGDLVRDWHGLAAGRPTVGFFPRRQHAQDAMALLRDSGVRAEYVDGHTPDEKRRDLFRQLGNGTIDYLCNVGIVERGTDIPEIQCVQLCTAIGTLSRYKQIIGRGSRKAPGKKDCIILDHGGNVRRLGLFEDEVAWTLDWSTRPSKDHAPRATVQCPGCKAIYRGGKCSNCGYEPIRRERLEQGLMFDGDELVEINPRGRKEKKKKTCEQIMIESLYRAGRSGKTFKQAVGMAYREAEKQGVRFKVPRKVIVAEKVFHMLPRGATEAGDRVRHLYPFTVGDWKTKPCYEPN